MILYQMLTGRFPYPVVGNIRDVIDHILLTEPTKPSSVSRQIDNDVETTALTCLAKEQPRRYQSALEPARDVRHYLAGDPLDEMPRKDELFIGYTSSLLGHCLARQCR